MKQVFCRTKRKIQISNFKLKSKKKKKFKTFFTSFCPALAFSTINLFLLYSAVDFKRSLFFLPYLVTFRAPACHQISICHDMPEVRITN